MIKNGFMQVHLLYRMHFRFIIRMKLTLIMMAFALTNVMANAYSQQKISLDVQKTKLSKILKLIEEKSDFYFVYSATNENLNKELSLNVENAKIVDLLPRLFHKTGLQYSVSNEGLVVVSEQQQLQVRGVVVDAKGNPLAGATVRLKGTQVAKATDINGRFAIDAVSGNILVASFAGYIMQEVEATSKGEMRIALTEDLHMLNEVVVTDLGDAISNINPDDIESVSVLKGAAASALYGSRAKAGVILITTKSGKGNSIDFSSNFVAERIIDQTDWQTTYGQGANGEKPLTALAAAQVGGSSWGAKLDGSDVVQFDGVARPYSAQKGNLGRFYRSGNTWTNSIAIDNIQRLIRGVSSLSQTNQPLYVINGVPIESKPVGQGNLNSRGNSGSQWDNAPDLGDAISNINPDDIESVSVLKGAAASALYGSRAKAGVILITTKSGKGNSIDFSSNFVAERIIDQTDWQTTYGQGANGEKPLTALAAAQVGGSSWGAKLDGSDVVQFDGVARPYSAQKGNLGRFYRSGNTWTNSIALNKTFDGGSIRLSATDVNNKSVVPNSGLKRQSFALVGTFEPFKGLKIDGRMNQILESVKNRPMVSDGAGNSNYNVMFLPTSLNVNTLNPWKDAEGNEILYNSGNVFATNPWFAAYEFQNNTKRDRNISSITARYTFDNGLFFQGRAGRDGYTDNYLHVLPSGTGYYPNGKIAEQNSKFTDINVDGLVGKTFSFGDYAITPNIGASYRHLESSVITNQGTDFALFGKYDILNAVNKSLLMGKERSETQSLYGTVEFAYKDVLYLNGSLRSDWFSTLATPGFDNKLNTVYPAVSTSFVFSEYVKPSWLSYGKLRAGFAKVGQATSPYQTALGYLLRSESLNGKPLGNIYNMDVPNSGLIASSAQELEIGTELRMFNDRLNIDFTWYSKKSKNEISSILTPSSTGYAGAILNAGEIQNKGIELLISGSIVKNENFKWFSSFNASYNVNKLLSLANGMTGEQLHGTSRSGVGFLMSEVNKPMFQVAAFDYKYDDKGEIVYLADGSPARGDLKTYGSSINKWAAGWNNEFSYKNLNVSFLIDGKFGGKMFTATDYYGYISGLHKETLERREELGRTAATYYTNVANNTSHRFVQSSDFIKLRQVVIGYNFPVSAFNNKVKSLNVSLVGRNLFVLMKKTQNVDPESSYNATVPGLELGGVPAVRTFGANLSVKF